MCFGVCGKKYGRIDWLPGRQAAIVIEKRRREGGKQKKGSEKCVSRYIRVRDARRKADQEEEGRRRRGRAGR